MLAICFCVAEQWPDSAKTPAKELKLDRGAPEDMEPLMAYINKKGEKADKRAGYYATIKVDPNGIFVENDVQGRDVENNKITITCTAACVKNLNFGVGFEQEMVAGQEHAFVAGDFITLGPKAKAAESYTYMVNHDLA